MRGSFIRPVYPAYNGRMASFGMRVSGALRLRAETFEEVEHDATATLQAALVVLLAGAASVAPVLAGSGAAVPLVITGILTRLLGWVIAALALLIVGMYVLLLLTGEYGISILTVICAFIIGMLGLQIITGYCGQISIGHAAFMGVGMYTVGILQKHFGIEKICYGFES